MAKAPVDVQLIEALRQGEQGAEERFLKTYYDHIFSFGMMVCGHREDAEDITQESLISALKAVGKLRSPLAFHVWLFRIVRNACTRQRLRHPGGEPKAVPLENAESGEAQADGAAWPDRMLQREETRRQVQQAIATLPAADRLVVLLRDFEGLTTEEVAKVMVLAPAAVKMRLLRARRKLRHALRGDRAVGMVGQFGAKGSEIPQGGLPPARKAARPSRAGVAGPPARRRVSGSLGAAERGPAPVNRAGSDRGGSG